MREPKDDWIHNAIGFALDRISSGEPHRHHRHCVHNLSAEEQKAAWRRRTPDPEEYEIIYGSVEPITCTPDDWEIEAPDLGPIWEDTTDE